MRIAAADNAQARAALTRAIQDLVRNANGPLRVFDAGTGTALIPIELLQRGFPGTITASDLAEQGVAQGNGLGHHGLGRPWGLGARVGSRGRASG